MCEHRHELACVCFSLYVSACAYVHTCAFVMCANVQ